MQTTPAHRGHQSGQVSHPERRRREQPDVDHRLSHPTLDEIERHQQQHTGADRPEDNGVGPAGAVAAVGLNAGGDPDQQDGQTHPEGDRPRPVDATGCPHPDLAQRAHAPDRADDSEWYTDPEDGLPVDLSKHPTDKKPEERTGDCGDHIDAKCHATLGGRKGVGEYSRRGGHQHCAPDALDHAPSDQPDRAGAESERIERQRDRGDREHDEPEVVHPDPAVHVAETTEGHHQDCGHHQVAHQHPEQIANVARLQGVQADTAEDGRKRDQHDRGIDGGQQGAQGCIRQHNPLVARVLIGGLGARKPLQLRHHHLVVAVNPNGKSIY